MNETGMILGRLDRDTIQKIIIKHPDEEIRELFMTFLLNYPKHPDEHGFHSLIVSQPIMIVGGKQ